MSQSSYLLDRSRAAPEPANRDRLFRRRLGKALRGLPRVSYRRAAHSLLTLRTWLSRRLRQRKAHNELKAQLDRELLLHAQALREAFQDAEEKARAEITLRIQAEQEARLEAEVRLEIERAARREAERRFEWLYGPLRRAHPEAIAKAEREMVSRIKAEQVAIRDAGT